MTDFMAKMHQNSISAVAPPLQTPLGELLLREGEGRVERGGEGKGGRKAFPLFLFYETTTDYHQRRWEEEERWTSRLHPCVCVCERERDADCCYQLHTRTQAPAWMILMWNASLYGLSD